MNGGVWCWGDNVGGQLGNNSQANSSTPVPVPGLTSGVTAITAGGYHTCAIVNGGAWCWGDNESGQLGANTSSSCLTSSGAGTFPCSPVPVPVSGLTSDVTAIAAGTQHTCAVVRGAVWCWGDNASGELGTASIPGPQSFAAVPVQASGLNSGASALAAGNRPPGFGHTCAVVNGGLWCWGLNAYGELGNNSITDSSVPVPVTGL